jgi:bifunctional DNA-binding transcriptional regulator/antitoxin component of YhaV-PrlF toxin-antitoxin module
VAEITMTPTDPHAYTVTVADGGRRTMHEVTVPAALADQLGVAAADEVHLVERSFEFLLEREPATSILPRFELDVIERYFPGYVEEMRRRVS